jgi:hypothetical protein
MGILRRVLKNTIDSLGGEIVHQLKAIRIPGCHMRFVVVLCWSAEYTATGL